MPGNRKFLPVKSVAILVAVSLLLYGMEYVLFHRQEEIVFGFLGNLAFLPIYVLFVTLMVERTMKEREKEAIRQKLNMIVGIFFSEVGNGLLCMMPTFLVAPEDFRRELSVRVTWEEADFRKANDFITGHDLGIDASKGDLNELKDFLVRKKAFMLTMMENPNLLEHDFFTDLLWAVFHLIEEMEARRSLEGLPRTDVDHLNGDIRRVYTHLTREYVFYLKHLKRHYPYLFSLAVRMNPMDPEARAVIS